MLTLFSRPPLDAGRYLDALIAEQVFGVRFNPHDPTPRTPQLFHRHGGSGDCRNAGRR